MTRPDHTHTEPPDDTPHVPYRRVRPHISQEPIDDLENDYVTYDRFQRTRTPGRNDGPTGHKHMGTAVSTGEYVPETPPTGEPNYARYLQTPKPGKSIFIARRNRRRRSMLIVVAAALIVVAIVVAALAIIF